MAFEDRLHASLGLYMQAPEWVRALGGRVYRAVPQRVRLGARHGSFLSDAQAQPQDIRWEHIAARLEASLHAAAAVPAHADQARHLLNLRSDPLQRLRELPLMSKADIKADLSAHLHPHFDASQRLPMFTGGSTAEPMSFYLHRHVSRSKESAYLRHIEHSLLGASPSDWALSLRGRTVARAGEPGERLWATEPIKRHLLFSSDHLEPRFMPAYVKALERLRPPLIHAFPSALYPLARWLDRNPAPAWTDHVKGVLLTSENVYDFQMALLRRVFPRARIVTHYGHSERVLMAVATGAEARAEFFPLYGLPELVDAQGRVIDEPGVLGEIVGTSFDNHVMPFLRYRTGDMGVWAEAPRYGGATKGTTRFLMQRIEGRCQEFVVCADHRLVSITTLGAAHFHELSQVDRIQFEQQRPGRVTLKIVTAHGLSAADKLRMAAAVRDKTQGGCEVDVQEVAVIERTARGKQRMLVQHLDLDHYLGAAITPEREDALIVRHEALAA